MILSGKGRMRITKLDADGQPTGEPSFVDNASFTTDPSDWRMEEVWRHFCNVEAAFGEAFAAERDAIRVEATVGRPIREIGS